MKKLNRLRIGYLILATIAAVMDTYQIVLGVTERNWVRIVVFSVLLLMVAASFVSAERSHKQAVEVHKRYEELISRLEQMKENNYENA